MNRTLEQIVSDIVRDVFASSQDYVLNKLKNNINEDDNPTLQLTKMINNSMLISTEMATTITIKLLSEIGLYELKEFGPKPDISVVWDSSKHQDKN